MTRRRLLQLLCGLPGLGLLLQGPWAEPFSMRVTPGLSGERFRPFIAVHPGPEMLLFKRDRAYRIFRDGSLEVILPGSTTDRFWRSAPESSRYYLGP